MIELGIEKAVYELEAQADDGRGNSEYKHKIQVQEIYVADKVADSGIDKILCWHYDTIKRLVGGGGLD